jgi:hypothetical protein
MKPIWPATAILKSIWMTGWREPLFKTSKPKPLMGSLSSQSKPCLHSWTTVSIASLLPMCGMLWLPTAVIWIPIMMKRAETEPSTFCANTLNVSTIYYIPTLTPMLQCPRPTLHADATRCWNPWSMNSAELYSVSNSTITGQNPPIEIMFWRVMIVRPPLEALKTREIELARKVQARRIRSDSISLVARNNMTTSSKPFSFHRFLFHFFILVCCYYRFLIHIPWFTTLSPFSLPSQWYLSYNTLSIYAAMFLN